MKDPEYPQTKLPEGRSSWFSAKSKALNSRANKSGISAYSKKAHRKESTLKPASATGGNTGITKKEQGRMI